MELNHTCLELLKTLYDRDDYLSVKELAERTGKTERSIRYSLDRIEDFFQKQGISLLRREFSKGIRLSRNAEARALSETFLATSTPYHYKFSTAERVLFLTVCLLLGRSGPIPIADMASRLTVSVGTVVGDLPAVEDWLSRHSLSLSKKPRMGLQVLGEEGHLRQVCLELVTESVPLEEHSSYLCGKPLESKISALILEELFYDLDVARLQDLPKQAEGLLNRVFSDESFENLIVFLAILAQRRRGGAGSTKPPDIWPDNLTVTGEYSAAGLLISLLDEQARITCDQGDCCALTSQLLASRSIERGLSTLGRDQSRSRHLTEVARQMVANMERLYEIDFGPRRDELVERLVTHMIPTVYRIRYQKQISNPIYDELATKHRRLLRFTKEASAPLAQYCGKNIDEQEISYLALYFLAALNQQDPQITHRPRVIVACGAGYGTAQVVASQLSNLFDVDIAAVLSGRNLSELMEKREVVCDYIVSTVDLPRLPAHYYIKVNPIFTRTDYEKIHQFMDTKPTRRNTEHHLEMAEHLTELAGRHGADRNLDQLKYEFLSILIHSDKQSDFLEVKSQLPTLPEVLSPQLIRLDVSCKDWRDVVCAGMAPMEEHGYVTADYKEAVMQNLLDYGAGMVMFPNTLVSHAAPASGCRKLGFGFLSLRHPVRFGNSAHDPVRIVFTLSVVDSTRHMDALMQLFRLLSEKENRDQLYHAKTKEEVLRLVKQISVN